MNIQGKLLEISDTQQIKDTFKKREFVLEYAENPQYPEYLKIELIQDRCNLLDQFNVGDAVDVHFNLKGRKWTDPQGQTKYFNSIQAWKIDPVGDQQTGAPPAEMAPPAEEPEWLSNNQEEDDLPF